MDKRSLTRTSVPTTSCFRNFDCPKIWILKAEIFSASHAHHPVTPSSKDTKMAVFRCIFLGAPKVSDQPLTTRELMKEDIGYGANIITPIYKFLYFCFIRKNSYTTFVHWCVISAHANPIQSSTVQSFPRIDKGSFQKLRKLRDFIR